MFQPIWRVECPSVAQHAPSSDLSFTAPPWPPGARLGFMDEVSDTAQENDAAATAHLTPPRLPPPYPPVAVLDEVLYGYLGGAIVHAKVWRGDFNKGDDDA